MSLPSLENCNILLRSEDKWPLRNARVDVNEIKPLEKGSDEVSRHERGIGIRSLIRICLGYMAITD